MMIHAGSGLMAEKRAAMYGEGSGDFATGSGVFLEVVLGAFIALWGGIDDFKPIRLTDSKKPRWETLHARPEFHCFKNRARFIRPLLEKSMEAPPTDMD